jgi:N-acetylneuraminate synthase
MSAEARKLIPRNTDISIYEIMDRCTLEEQDEIKLKKYVESKGMIFLSTPFSRAATDRLERMGVCHTKSGQENVTTIHWLSILPPLVSP